MLSTKKLLYKILGMLEVKTTTFTPTAGSTYSPYGGCWYQQYGRLVHVHVGLQGLTANASTTVYTMPSGLRPSVQIVSQGRGGNTNSVANISVMSSGAITVTTPQTYAAGELYYFV